MDKLHEKNLIFITGIKGSGTTMMAELLSVPDFSVGVGFDYITPGCESYAKIIREAVQYMWNISTNKNPRKIAEIKETIRNLTFPENIKYVILKCSFPFMNKHIPFKKLTNFPSLLDLFDLNSATEFIIMKRDPKRCAVSGLRRNHVDSIIKSAHRTEEGIIRLETELKKINKSLYRIVPYKKVLKKQKKYLENLENFINFPPCSLQNRSDIISLPTKESKRKFIKSWIYLFYYFNIKRMWKWNIINPSI